MGTRKRNRASIYDIAAEAGVSIAMVSRVVNGSGPVAAAKRARVEEALRRHDYRPNAAARSLARRDTNVFGVLVGSSGAEYAQLFASRVLAGISEWCRGTHRNVLLLWCTPDSTPKMLLKETAPSVDGLLLLDTRYSAEWREALSEAGTPAVLINEAAPDGSQASVLVDNPHGGKLAVDHLIGAGHHRIGLITGDLRLQVGRDRHQGAMAALADAGVSCPEDWVVDARFRPGLAREAVQRIYASGGSGCPSALFVASDLMAFAVVDELRVLGLRVPDDVSVVGYDDSLIAPLAHPPLTSVAQPLVRMGREAGGLLEDIIREPSRKRTIMLPVSLRERDSVAWLA